MKVRYYVSGLLMAVGLCACSQEVKTYSLPQALYDMEVPDSMYRGIDYLGTAGGYHYFEKKREAAADVAFRIPASAYTPAQQFEYRAWFPQRTEVSGEWAAMVLSIIPHGSSYRYTIGGQCYDNAAAVPPHMWQKVYVVKLPHKADSLNTPAKASVASYLKKNRQPVYMQPISGLAPWELQGDSGRAGNGAISNTALDALFETQR